MTPPEQNLRELDAEIAFMVFGRTCDCVDGFQKKLGHGQYSMIKRMFEASGGAGWPEKEPFLKCDCHPHYTTDAALALSVLKRCAEKLWNDNPDMKRADFKLEIWNNGLWVVAQSEKPKMFIEAETLELAIAKFAQKLYSK